MGSWIPQAGTSCEARGRSLSYIDTFDNWFVVFFGGLPAYHPLLDVPDTPDCPEHFGCDPGHLVIGGGPGEHPGIVLVRPGEAVLGFVRTWLDEYERLYPDKYQALKPTVAALPD